MSIGPSFAKACLFVGCFVSSPVLSQSSIFESSLKVQEFNVKIYALSTSIHAGTQNQETYLADITSKDGEEKLAKLIDVYPAEGSRIDPNILREVPLLNMKVVRAPFCDIPANHFYFSDRSLIFEDAVKREIIENPSKILPCFRIVHKSVKLKAKSH